MLRNSLKKQLSGVRGDFIPERFNLPVEFKKSLICRKPQFGFGGLGELVYYRTYSRNNEGKQEKWADTVIRVVEGVMSIRKSHMVINKLNWKDENWIAFSTQMAEYMFDMKFMPPGRGLFACGTEYVSERGSMALNNCAAVSTEDLVTAVGWAMDALMCGCGVGFDTIWQGKVISPDKSKPLIYSIPDTREGWVLSVVKLLEAYCPDDKGKVRPFPKFLYNEIRQAGQPIKGFGGISSGPDPLIKLHKRIEAYLDCYIASQTLPPNLVIHQMMTKLDNLILPPSTLTSEEKIVLNNTNKTYERTRLIVDIFNAVGACVVAGNVRRSSQIALGQIDDNEFMSLKDYSFNPERQSIGWNSNNSVQLFNTLDCIDPIVEGITRNGEPGVYNLSNVQRGRLRHNVDSMTREGEPDTATLINPCLAPDTMICTSEGVLPIYKLIGKKFQAICDGKVHDSTDQGFWYSGMKDIYKITMKNGTVIKATEDHRFLSSEGNWIAVKDIYPGQQMKIHSTPIEYGGFGSYDEGYIAANIILRGAYSNNIVSFQITTMGKYESNPMANQIEKVIPGASRTRLWSKYNYNCYLLESPEIAVIIDKYRLGSNRIPLGGSSSFNRGLIQGLFDIDLFYLNDEHKISPVSSIVYSSDSRISIFHGNKNEEFLLRLQQLLLTFGINSYIQDQSLVVLDFTKFKEQIGSINPRKRNFLEKGIVVDFGHSNRVSSVEYFGKSEVYDCSIPGFNCFIANGFVSHNCGEIPLNSFELCNLSEVVIPRTSTVNNSFNYHQYLKSLEFATFYASTVSLLPTHSELSNEIIERNRRIGVSLTGVAGFYERFKGPGLIKYLNSGYQYVRKVNTRLAEEADVVPSLRVTTIKPSGTVPQLPGVTPGIHFPIESRYVKRRIRISEDNPISKFLIERGVRCEPDVCSDRTLIFEFPIDQGPGRSVKDVSVWEQLKIAEIFQREWSDNSVSVTVHYNCESEEQHLKGAITSALPNIKSLSLMPHSTDSYAQPPYESISEDEYHSSPKFNIDWSRYTQQTTNMPRYCDSDKCELN